MHLSQMLSQYLDIYISNTTYFFYSQNKDRLIENSMKLLIEIISLIIRGSITKGILQVAIFAPTSLYTDQVNCPRLGVYCENALT
jgi:hypothetical protein